MIARLRRPVPLTLALAVAVLASTPVAHAQLATRPASEWSATLDSPSRVESMKVPELMARLGIQREQVIADVGCGTGTLTGPMALATGPRGVVYASDIDKALLDLVQQRVQSSRLTNVRTVLGTFTDPLLPQQVDLAVMNDVLHHVQDRPLYLKNLARHIKRGGRLAIVEFTPEGSPHRSQPELVVPEAQVNEWAAAAGLERSEAFSLYTDRYFVIYTKR